VPNDALRASMGSRGAAQKRSVSAVRQSQEQARFSGSRQGPKGLMPAERLRDRPRGAEPERQSGGAREPLNGVCLSEPCRLTYPVVRLATYSIVDAIPLQMAIRTSRRAASSAEPTIPSWRELFARAGPSSAIAVRSPFFCSMPCSLSRSAISVLAFSVQLARISQRVRGAVTRRRP
jgi:hypothetical protein